MSDKGLEAWRIAANDFEISIRLVGLARSLALIEQFEPELQMFTAGRTYAAYGRAYAQREHLSRSHNKGEMS
jgi:hypothetical protein